MAAIAWWTDQVDQERERAQLAEMMRISLEEAERRRAAVLPLHDWSDADLLAHFAGSALLAQVQSAVCQRVVFTLSLVSSWHTLQAPRCWRRCELLYASGCSEL